MKNLLLVHEHKQRAINHARGESLSETKLPRCDVLHLNGSEDVPKSVSSWSAANLPWEEAVGLRH